ncbi:hydantoinase/oxoprolinase family protein [Deltaproteobacteria bacterium OttesenSCG-928-K17]|nr:hydantoinase/oxoprolinase family protein [Deltaproteobacteria bacterium OttesenSCG-928-K17]
MKKKYYLGIDTGGTHTDAVVFDPVLKNVAATAKAETTHHDLAIGITDVFRKLADLQWDGGLAAIDRIHLSTTLATNAIAENKGRRVGLILMGYDKDQSEVRELISGLPRVSPVFIGGRHDFYGREEEPLDEKALRAAVQAMDNEVSGWAVSGFFSVKNPAHEMRAAAAIGEISSKSVTMGRDLTGRLDAVRRAATAALNAGLVSIIGSLLDAVKSAAEGFGLKARLMVVKGDGTLVSEQWAREKPIETVVSGPAAGLVGAKLLARNFLAPGEDNLWVLDVGGTTSDLALVEKGLPAVNPNGARVGDWETMTMAVETRTRGLGGDSLVTLTSQGEIILGPRRVMPLCRLARRWPKVVETLKYQKVNSTPSTVAGCFFVPGTPPEPGMNADEMAIINAMRRETPFSMAKFAEEAFEGDHHFIGLKGVEHPSILVAAFTPTDAMRILGMYDGGSREAAEYGALMMGRPLKMKPEVLARKVLDEFGRQMAKEIISHGLAREGLTHDADDFEISGIFGAALTRRPHGRVEINWRLPDPVVLLGAPVAILAPFLAANLSAKILTPPSFDVASALGAAASPVYLKRKVEINALPYFEGYRLFLPDGVVDGRSIDELAQVAMKHMDEHMRALAELAGADKTSVSVVREDRRAALNDGSRLEMGASLTFTAEPWKKSLEEKTAALMDAPAQSPEGAGPGAGL